MAGELKVCCASGRVGSRTHQRSTVWWLMSAFKTLSVMHPYVWSAATIGAHYCCLRRAGKLRSSTSLSLLSLTVSEDVLGTFLRRFLLSRSLELLHDVPLAHAGCIAGSVRDVFGVRVACNLA